MVSKQNVNFKGNIKLKIGLHIIYEFYYKFINIKQTEDYDKITDAMISQIFEFLKEIKSDVENNKIDLLEIQNRLDEFLNEKLYEKVTEIMNKIKELSNIHLQIITFIQNHETPIIFFVDIRKNQNTKYKNNETFNKLVVI